MLLEFPAFIQLSLLAAIAIFCFFRRSSRFSLFRLLLLLSFLFYLFQVIELTLFPIPLSHTAAWGAEGLASNLQLFYSIYAAIRDHNYIQVVGNTLLLFPLGFYIPWFTPKRYRLWQITGIGFVCSLGIELAQLLFNVLFGSYRIFDVDDLLLNTAGMVAGYYSSCLIFILFAILNVPFRSMFTRKS
ncbi:MULTISPECIES: VanZ family protein [Paenibacillus]|uniref:VanZ family protein n=1 Tax=Paenibacillus TaxID=44249 RepID=UPI0022B85D48|nr:VanZ family protein [Paenibacillus caseinilyticus]MCZ8520435.1 VanZ family protein [Paenibacillus caseinilyticus]